MDSAGICRHLHRHVYHFAVRFVRSVPSMLLLTVMLGAWSCARAANVYVIAHPDVRLSAASIRDVYIGEQQYSGAIRIIPIDNTTAQAEFLEKVLKLERAHYTKLWLKKSFRDAVHPPVVKNNDKETVDLVRRTPGAIAYVSGKPPRGVAVIRKY